MEAERCRGVECSFQYCPNQAHQKSLWKSFHHKWLSHKVHQKAINTPKHTSSYLGPCAMHSVRWRICIQPILESGQLTVLDALCILEHRVGGCTRCISTSHYRQHGPVHLGPGERNFLIRKIRKSTKNTHRSRQRGRRRSCTQV